MADFIFRGIFDTEQTAVITPGAFVLCVGVSLLIGLMLCAMTLWPCSPAWTVWSI